LVAAEDAVVAAVRMAYNVAAAQVDRSTRLAQRLREAGDRAVGPRSDRKALDATEQLVIRGLMGAVTWLEGAAAERDSPLKRLLVAEYRLVGSILGLTLSEQTPSSPRRASEAAAQSMGPRGTDDSDATLNRVKVVLEGQHRRPVRTRRCEVATGAPLKAPVQFYCVEQIESDPLMALLDIDVEGRATISLEISRLAPPGFWRAAVCDDAGLQIGLIEIEL
jgi:hypothetical protein